MRESELSGHVTTAMGLLPHTAHLKQLPAPSSELLFFPERDSDYQHFENAEQYPFNYDARQFSRMNAWWLADAALLAYWDPAPARDIWRRAGLQFEFISVPGSQCHVGWSDRFVIVAFRGTQPDEMMDLFDISRIELAGWTYGGGAVHSGFLEAHGRIWPAVENLLRQLNPTRRTVWFTGHSLGGALATLSMDRFAASAGLYTIGSPRVGNHRFAALFDERHDGRCFRYVNNRDVVTHLPPAITPAGFYKHVDLRRFIDANGAISSASLSIIDMLSLPWTTGAVSQALERGRVDLPLPGWLIDHTPRRYAVHIWNDYATHGV